ncbi:YgaP family membrane protein [Halarcobacter anaerophilus]|jgi:hypothetical protein|uniref:DUF2892 domain-containing protein n=1 Tax=Halarcobacter anaerophilus TaxID=877500 RepID=A0A4Q0Y4P4_9BACT|nr:DUF2892 domain-containing protein [Halarcobacter anaerophilus]QDF29307.1 hypothetical protein AANAER_1833 [Halarcobacter anaerophilus]RXJ64555.1 DUF2892 domain-containing protein [Halarcobacter anaerophilus]
MNKFDKIRAFCRPFRVVLGIVLIAIGIFTGIAWFYLGVIPLIAGLTDFCPVCIISKKCTPRNLQKS